MCRTTLRETLANSNSTDSHPVYALLSQADAWSRWEAAGRQATEEARQVLRAHGANVVYARNDGIWEEHPDGTMNRVEDLIRTAS